MSRAFQKWALTGFQGLIVGTLPWNRVPNLGAPSHRSPDERFQCVATSAPGDVTQCHPRFQTPTCGPRHLQTLSNTTLGHDRFSFPALLWSFIFLPFLIVYFSSSSLPNPRARPACIQDTVLHSKMSTGSWREDEGGGRDAMVPGHSQNTPGTPICALRRSCPKAGRPHQPPLHLLLNKLVLEEVLPSLD